MFGATCRHFIARLAGLRLILNCSYGLLLVGYCFGIRSERRLCEEVHLNLAYRWFCRLGLDGEVPDHSTFSKNRHGADSTDWHNLAACRRAVREYLDTLDQAAWGAASETVPK